VIFQLFAFVAVIFFAIAPERALSVLRAFVLLYGLGIAPGQWNQKYPIPSVPIVLRRLREENRSYVCNGSKAYIRRRSGRVP
jgi:hypothetical protein